MAANVWSIGASGARGFQLELRNSTNCTLLRSVCIILGKSELARERMFMHFVSYLKSAILLLTPCLTNYFPENLIASSDYLILQ